MRIGIIGSVRVGSTVGGPWAKAGHQAMFASRHPGRLADLVPGLGADASSGTPPELAGLGEVPPVAMPPRAQADTGWEIAPAIGGKMALETAGACPSLTPDLA